MNEVQTADQWYCKKCRVEETAVANVCSRCGRKTERTSTISSKGIIAVVAMTLVLVVGVGLMVLIVGIGMFGPFNGKEFTDADKTGLASIFGVGGVLVGMGGAGIFAGLRQRRTARYQPWLLAVILAGLAMISVLALGIER